ESGGVIVKHRTDKIDPAVYVYHSNFAPGIAAPQSPVPGLSRGAYGAGTDVIPTTYDFRGLDLNGDRTLAGLQAGFDLTNGGDLEGNILVQSKDVTDDASDDATINVLALVELDRSGVAVGDGDTSVI